MLKNVLKLRRTTKRRSRAPGFSQSSADIATPKTVLQSLHTLNTLYTEAGLKAVEQDASGALPLLKQGLAEHLSSLHRAVVEKVVTITGFGNGKGEESLGLQDDIFEDGSENSPLSSVSSTQGSMSPLGTSPEDGSEDESGCDSTHYTIKDDRRRGSPLSMTNISEDSGSTHYDIGSSGSASGIDETESEAS